MPNYSSLTLPTSSSCSFLPPLFNSGLSRSCASGKGKPITLNCVNARSLQRGRLRSSAELRIMRVRSSNNAGSSTNVTIKEHKREGTRIFRPKKRPIRGLGVSPSLLSHLRFRGCLCLVS